MEEFKKSINTNNISINLSRFLCFSYFFISILEINAKQLFQSMDGMSCACIYIVTKYVVCLWGGLSKGELCFFYYRLFYVLCAYVAFHVSINTQGKRSWGNCNQSPFSCSGSSVCGTIERDLCCKGILYSIFSVIQNTFKILHGNS